MKHHEHGTDGKFVPASTPDDQSVHIKPDERSPWKKHWDEIGECIEQAANSGANSPYFDTLTVNAVIHAQVLKRYDPRCTPEG